MAWQRGDVIVHRELWRGRPWCAIPNVVVEDTTDLLATYLPEEAPLAFPPSFRINSSISFRSNFVSVPVTTIVLPDSGCKVETLSMLTVSDRGRAAIPETARLSHTHSAQCASAQILIGCPCDRISIARSIFLPLLE